MKFSEGVIGLNLDDLAITGGTLSNLVGSGDTYTVDVTPELGQVVSVSLAEGAATDSAGNLSQAASYSVQAGSPLTEFDAKKDIIKAIIVDEAIRTVQNRITANRSMMNGARARFIAANKAGCAEDLNTVVIECAELPERTNIAFDVDGSMTASAGNYASNGFFFGQKAVGNGD